MDERAVIAEGTETCQGEFTIEDGSVGNGTIDADGAQSHEAERISDAQSAQVVESNGSMDSGGIAGAGSQLGAAEDFGSGTVGTGSSGTTAKEGKKPKVRGKNKGGKQSRLSSGAKAQFRKERDKEQ